MPMRAMMRMLNHDAAAANRCLNLICDITGARSDWAYAERQYVISWPRIEPSKKVLSTGVAWQTALPNCLWGARAILESEQMKAISTHGRRSRPNARINIPARAFV